MEQTNLNAPDKLMSNGKLAGEITEVIKSVFNVTSDEITDIEIINKGLTNRSFTFFVKGEKYIMRIPGADTDGFINRREEALIYGLLKGKEICEDVVYINPENGYKIAKYIDNAHNCGYYDFEEIKKCMRKLRSFHELKLQTDNTYDLFYYCQFYEDLWKGRPSRYGDYFETKEKIFSLKSFLDSYDIEYSLTHIDPNPDNFMIYTDAKGMEQIRLIDWEYAAMQDPFVDIAMFCVYAIYDEEQIEKIIGAYFYDGITERDKLRLYCYIAVCALNFSNWCEMKNDPSLYEFNDHLYNMAKKYYAHTVSNITKERQGD